MFQLSVALYEASGITIIHQKTKIHRVIFDPKGGTFRSELYEEYKGTT